MAMAPRFLHSMGFLAIVAFLSLTMPAAAAAVLRPEPEVKPSDTDALTIFRHGADAHGILAANWSTPDAGAGRASAAPRTAAASPRSRSRRSTCGGHSTGSPTSASSAPSTSAATASTARSTRSSSASPTSRCSTSPTTSPAPSRAPSPGSPASSASTSPTNSLRGPILAAALAKLTRLLTLKLQDNLLTGLLPDITTVLPRLADFNASNNQLSGRVPDAMRAKFDLASFSGNAGLCGLVPPLPPCSLLPREPAPTSSSVPSSSSQSVVPSSPAASSSSSVASSSPTLATPESHNGAGKGALSTGAVAGIAVGNAIFLFALLSLLVAYSQEKEKRRPRRPGGWRRRAVRVQTGTGLCRPRARG